MTPPSPRRGRACGRGLAVGWASCSQAWGSTAGMTPLSSPACPAGAVPVAVAWRSAGRLVPPGLGLDGWHDAAVVAALPGRAWGRGRPGARCARSAERRPAPRPAGGRRREAGVFCAPRPGQSRGGSAAGIAGMVRVLVTYAATWPSSADSLMAPARSSSASRVAASRIASACSAACRLISSASCSAPRSVSAWKAACRLTSSASCSAASRIALAWSSACGDSGRLAVGVREDPLRQPDGVRHPGRHRNPAGRGRAARPGLPPRAGTSPRRLP